VAFPIFKRFQTYHSDVKFHLLIVRKIPVPYNPEAGFGAITLDGTIILNEPLVLRLGLTEAAIRKQATKVLAQMRDRMKKYGLESPSFDLQGRTAILVDDGLASGFTMIAAIQSIRKYSPTRIIVAVPTAPRSSVERVAPLVDEIICPNVRDTLYFAVADAYQNWYDLDFLEVQQILHAIDDLTSE